jgi:hypothetical protein
MSMLIIHGNGLRYSLLEHFLVVSLGIYGLFSNHSKASQSESFSKLPEIDPGQADTLGKYCQLSHLVCRWMRNIVGPYMLYGGSLALSYQLIFDFLRHHEETNNDRPLYFDHLFAVTAISATATGIWGGLPKYWFTGGFVGFLLLAPASWWFAQHGKMNAAGRNPNIFY